MSSEWVYYVDSLDSIQHEQSYFEVGLGVQLNTDWYETVFHLTKLNTSP